ncbi:MAG: hypothetical protein R2834_17995 [Rhodothermales bacterium]
MARSSAHSTFFFLVTTLTLAGCLPSSCNRTESRALFPSDSLSRAIAEATPVDTLVQVWDTGGPEARPFEYPRTVFFDAAGRLFLSDAEANTIHAFDDGGQPLYQVTDDEFPVPFLAGIAGDTLAVFSPSRREVRLMVGERVVATVPTPADASSRQQLQYAAYGPGGVYVKILGESFDNFAGRLDETGRVTERWPLEGPIWRYAGKMLAQGDTLLSACGYRPVMDRFLPAARRDTLALVGFDSPMLARSRLFMLGDQYDPPLLTASFAVAGDRLFVLNIRPGWLWIDAYDRTGRLERQLVQPSPSFAKSFYPVDLAVRPDGDDYEIAVAFVEPQPRLALYRWRNAPPPQ